MANSAVHEILEKTDEAQCGAKPPLVPRTQGLQYDLYKFLRKEGRKLIRRLLSGDLQRHLTVSHHLNIYKVTEDPELVPSHLVSQASFKEAGYKFDTSHDSKKAKNCCKSDRTGGKVTYRS